MLVVIFADAAFVRREREMLMRLEVGLADEGVRVVHALPKQLAVEETSASGGGAGGIAGGGSLYSTVVGYEAGGMAISRRLRAARLLDEIQERLELPERKIDIVHAFGLEPWHIGLDLARLSSAGILLELFDAATIGPAASLASRRVGVRTVEYSVAEPAMRRALRKRAHNAHVHVAPWGVHSPAQLPVRTRPQERPLAVGMISDGRDSLSVRAALAGLQECMKSRGEFLVFAGVGPLKYGRDPAVWAAARELDLVDRVSLVPEIEARREPMMQMDMLILPEASGRQRTLTLDAMAHGVSLVAAGDELIEALIPDRTASIVKEPTPSAWRDAIAQVIDDQAYAQSLRTSAHQFVRSERAASGQVAAVLTAYNAMVAAAQVGVKM